MSCTCTNPGKTRLNPFVFLLLLLVTLPGCGVLKGERSPVLTGEIVHRGVIDCFEAGLTSDEGLRVYCETSAIVFDGQRLVMASDKPVPGDGNSAVFSFDYSGQGSIKGTPEYLTSTPFINAIKYEDMTITPDGQYVIASTGFDRIKSDSNEWDGFNTLLFWPVSDPQSVRLVSPSAKGGVASSVSLRQKFSQALLSEEFPDEVPYFKVESLAAIPGNRLLFGIRELGVRYDQFVYAFKILSVDYRVIDGALELIDDFELIYDFDLGAKTLPRNSSALSSIEYDPNRDQLFLLTSFEEGETDEDIGGALWTLPLDSLKSGTPPDPVRTPEGKPVSFAHKSEGVTILGRDLLMIIHDDDRVLGREQVTNPETQFSRQAHQGAYTLVSIISR